MSDSELLRFVPRLYEAGANEELWQDTVAEIARALDASTAFLQVRSSGQPEIITQLGHSPEALDQYQRHFWKVDIWAQRSSCVCPMLGYASPDFVTDRDVTESEYYNDYLKPNVGVFYAAGVLIPVASDSVAIVAFHQERRAGSPSLGATNLLTELAPHFQRVFQIRRRLRRYKDAARIAYEALDILARSIVLATRDGRVTFANIAARTLEQKNDGLSLANGRISAGLPAETRRLHELIHLATLDPGRTSTAGGAMRLSRPSGCRGFHVLVAPARSSRLQIHTKEPAQAIIFIDDPDRPPVPTVEQLRSLYGLTRRETELGLALLRGDRLEHIAEMHCVRMPTIRSQMRALFSKTGTQRQSELIRLLVALEATTSDHK